MNCQVHEVDTLAKLPLVISKIDFDSLQVPSLPPPLFHFNYNKTLESKISFSHNQRKLVLPDSALVEVALVSARRLTSGDTVKETLELSFKFQNEIIEYNPGDSFGFLCPNNYKEVDLLLNRLNLQNVADAPTNIVLDGATASKKKLPVNIPPLFSLREIFLHCVEIQAVPKKILFRIIANYTADKVEKQCLLFLSSQEGSNYFTELVRKPALSVFDILSHYPSCKPPVEKIIECLPPLRPRFYSVASSQLTNKDIFKIIFNVVKLKKDHGRQMDREGVCTGWLKNLSYDMIENSTANIVKKFSELQLDNKAKTAFVYKRKNSHFHFPTHKKTPVIMVGPGTGVAPFISYLQHLEEDTKSKLNKAYGENWLFYGCRFQERDFLYKIELKRFVDAEILKKLILSFSRDTRCSNVPKYVQDSIRFHAQELADAMKCGKILVCGDAANMAPEVQNAFVKALQIGSGIDESQAKSVIESMQKEHRYVVDVWA